MIELFAKGETNATLREHAEKLKQAIKDLPDNKILGADFDEWTNYYFEEYKIQPITHYFNIYVNDTYFAKVAFR